MKYIGVRSSIVPPEADIDYLGSSKYVPKLECDKIVLNEFLTRKEAVAYEIRLHELFNVGCNPVFYNKAKQTSTGFDMSGHKHSKEFCENLSKRNITKGVKPPLNFLGKFGDAHNKSKHFWLKDLEGNITRYGSGLELTRAMYIDSSCVSYARTHFCGSLPTKYTFSRGKLKGYTVYFVDPHFEIKK